MTKIVGQISSNGKVYGKGDNGKYYVKRQDGKFYLCNEKEFATARSIFSQNNNTSAQQQSSSVNQPKPRPKNAKTVYGSKSGRYYVQDEKTGKIRFYNKDGVEITRDSFMKTENAFMNEDGEIKAYNWWEKTKAAARGVKKMAYDMVTSEQPVRDKNGKVVKNKDGSIKTERKFDLGRTVTTVVVGAAITAACVCTAPALVAAGVAAGTAAAIGTGVSAAIGGYFVYQGGKKMYAAEQENQRTDITNEQKIKNWEDKGAGGAEVALGLTMVKGAGKGYAKTKTKAANTADAVKVKNQATRAQKGKVSALDNARNRYSAYKENTPSASTAIKNAVKHPIKTAKAVAKTVAKTVSDGIKNVGTSLRQPVKSMKKYGNSWVEAKNGYKEAFTPSKKGTAEAAPTQAQPTGYEDMSFDELSMEAHRAAETRSSGRQTGELTPEELNLAREIDTRLAKETPSEAGNISGDGTMQTSYEQLQGMKQKLSEAKATPESRISNEIKNSTNPKETYKKLMEEFKGDEAALKQLETELKSDKSIPDSEKAELYRDLYKKQHELNPEKYPDVEAEISNQQIERINKAKSRKELQKIKAKEKTEYSQEAQEAYNKKYQELRAKENKKAKKDSSKSGESEQNQTAKTSAWQKAKQTGKKVLNKVTQRAKNWVNSKLRRTPKAEKPQELTEEVLESELVTKENITTSRPKKIVYKDKNGNVVKTEEITYEPSEGIAKEVIRKDADGNFIEKERTYNDGSYIIEVPNKNGSTLYRIKEHYNAADNTRTTYEANGNHRSVTKDANGNITKIEDFNAEKGVATVRNGEGKITQITELGENGQTCYAYDSEGRLSFIDNSTLKKEISFDYMEDGSVRITEQSYEWEKASDWFYTKKRGTEQTKTVSAEDFKAEYRDKSTAPEPIPVDEVPTSNPPKPAGADSAPESTHAKTSTWQKAKQTGKKVLDKVTQKAKDFSNKFRKQENTNIRKKYSKELEQLKSLKRNEKGKFNVDEWQKMIQQIDNLINHARNKAELDALNARVKELGLDEFSSVKTKLEEAYKKFETAEKPATQENNAPVSNSDSSAPTPSTGETNTRNYVAGGVVSGEIQPGQNDMDMALAEVEVEEEANQAAEDLEVDEDNIETTEEAESTEESESTEEADDASKGSEYIEQVENEETGTTNENEQTGKRTENTETPAPANPNGQAEGSESTGGNSGNKETTVTPKTPASPTNNENVKGKEKTKEQDSSVEETDADDDVSDENTKAQKGERTLSQEEMHEISEVVINAKTEEEIRFALRELKNAGVFKGRKNLRKLLNRKLKLLKAQNDNNQQKIDKYTKKVNDYTEKVEQNRDKTDDNFENKMRKKGLLDSEA